MGVLYSDRNCNYLKIKKPFSDPRLKCGGENRIVALTQFKTKRKRKSEREGERVREGKEKLREGERES